jgi:3-hydroxyacyl-CoA dehydrogenase
MTDFYRDFSPDWTYIRDSEWYPQATTPDEVDHYVRFENCVECGACVSACPVTAAGDFYMGPAALADLTGIDINYHVNKTFEKRLGERYKVHPLTELIYQTGCYGRKTGAGYMDYSGDAPVPNQKVVDVVQAYLKDNQVNAREMSEQEIVDLMLANAINEAAYMMEEGICDRPQDMDLAMIYGTGFPPYRGGILRYADKWGLANVYHVLQELETRYGVHFKPADLIKEMTESGKTFYTS